MPDPSLTPTIAETPALRMASGFDDESPRERESAAPLFGPATAMPRIGRYVVLERIGAGGMGEVFSAFDDDLDRKIAIKVVHADIAEESTMSGVRLLREAQTLAKVSHNNVVHVYEVGTVLGRLFIAMEFIRGQSLRQWRSEPRTSEEITAVFMQAGAGLRAVHEAGLVHRDFKPDNVLVGDDGRICVADFGLARSAALGTDPPPADELSDPESSLPSGMNRPISRLTASGAIIGTPAYMAPEQLRSHAIDARCDQFSFCVAMWEALADERPFPATSLPDLVQAHRKLCPEPPAGLTVPARVWKVLQRGLSIDPSARYENMAALLAALQQPVRRSRVGTLLGVGAGAFVVGALLFAPHDAGPCPSADTSMDGIWDAATARSVYDAVAAVPVPWAAATADDVRTHLDAHADGLLAERNAACVATHIEGTQSVARLDRRIACLDRVTTRFGALTTALQSPDEIMAGHAPEAARGLPDPRMCRGAALDSGMAPPATPAQAARVRASRGAAGAAWAQLALGKATTASAASARIDDAATTIDYPPLHAELSRLRGEIAGLLGDRETARTALLEAVDLAEGSHHDTLAAGTWLALTRLSVGELRDAKQGRRWLRRARAAATRLGPDRSREAELARHEADLDRLAGDLTAAKAKLQPLLDGAPDTPVAGVYAAMAGVLWDLGDLDAAYELHQRHRAQLVQRLGPEHPMLAATYFNLGAIEAERGHEPTARQYLARAQKIYESTYGERHSVLAQVHVVLQQLDMSSGALASAQAHARAAVQIQRASLPPGHAEIGLALQALGAAAYLSGDASAAVTAYEEALEIQAAALGPAHRATAVVRANLAEALLAMGATDRAHRQAGRALHDLEAAHANPVLVAFAQRVQGTAYLGSGQLGEAIAALQGAQVRMRGQAAFELERGVLHTDLARALSRAGRDTEATQAATAARTILRTATGEACASLLAQLDREFPPTPPPTTPTQDTPTSTP